ncbi:MAG: ABC transporter ATP-binding protein [Candidatus Nanopelagicales bacterium]
MSLPSARPTASPSGPILQLAGVSKAYRNPAETTPVFEHIDLNLVRGEITSLVGPSGCGKSTIISLIAGLMAPDEGRVVFDGNDVAELSDTERAHLRATRMGIVLQSANLVPFLTASENISVAMRLAGAKASPSHVAELLDMVGLGDRSDHLPRRLSGGEAQRASLAVALGNAPDLLLADEAVGQLDSATAELVMEIFHKACRERGLSVLLVTHSTEVASLGDRVVRLVEGHLESDP